MTPDASMDQDQGIRQALADLADESVGPGPIEPGAPRRVAAAAMRRARRRHIARVVGPVVVAVAIATSAGVAFRGTTSTNRVSTAGAPSHLPIPPPTAAPTPTSLPAGVLTLPQPVVVAGWVVTTVPSGMYLTATTATIADFGPTGAGCAGKPTVAVTVYNNPDFSIDSLLAASSAAGNPIPVPLAGMTGVEQPPAPGTSCPQEVIVSYQPSAGTIIQIATTTTGVAGAQIVADGIEPAS